MPEQLETFEFTGAGSRYDWDALLNGSIWRLTHGTDFNAKPTSFLATVRKQASKRNMDIRSQVEGDNSLVIQATPRTANAE